VIQVRLALRVQQALLARRGQQALTVLTALMA